MIANAIAMPTRVLKIYGPLHCHTIAAACRFLFSFWIIIFYGASSSSRISCKALYRIIAPNDNLFTWARPVRQSARESASSTGKSMQSHRAAHNIIILERKVHDSQSTTAAKWMEKYEKINFGWVIEFRIPETIMSLHCRKKKHFGEQNEQLMSLVDLFDVRVAQQQCSSHIRLSWICK